MNGKKIGKLIIVIGVIALLVWLWFTLGPKDNGNQGEGGEGLPEVPFSGGIIDNVDDGQVVDGSDFEIRFDDEGQDSDVPQPTLFRVSHVPVTNYYTQETEKEFLVTTQSQIEIVDEEAGESVFETVENDSIENITIPVLTYNDYESGYVFERELFFEEWDVTQMTDTVIQNAQEVFFGADGGIVYRYADPTGNNEITYAGIQKEKQIFEEASCPQVLDANLQQGDQGRDVEALQTLLQELFGYTAAAPGLFDSELALFLSTLQSEQGLNQTGALTQQTREWLLAECIENTEQELRSGDNAQAQFSIEGSFDNRGIEEVAVSPDKTKRFVLITTHGITKGIVEDFSSQNQNTIYSLPFNEWNIQWVNNEIIALTTKASGQVEGHLYTIDVESGSLQKRYSAQGLTTLVAPSAEKVLIGRRAGNGYELRILDLQTGVSDFVPLSDTFPEKCTWGPGELIIYCAVPNILTNGVYPDRYYMGLVNVSDTLWYYNMGNGASGMIDDIALVASQNTAGPDVNNLQLFKSNLPGQPWFLFFKNQTTGYVWAKQLPPSISPEAEFTAEQSTEEIE